MTKSLLKNIANRYFKPVKETPYGHIEMIHQEYYYHKHNYKMQKPTCFIFIFAEHNFILP
jgi:hypothetical protein